MKFFDNYSGCLLAMILCILMMMFTPGLFFAFLGIALVGSFIAQIIAFFLD